MKCMGKTNCQQTSTVISEQVFSNEELDVYPNIAILTQFAYNGMLPVLWTLISYEYITNFPGLARKKDTAPLYCHENWKQQLLSPSMIKRQ